MIEFETPDAVWGELVANMGHGFVFVPGISARPDLAACRVDLIYPGTQQTMSLQGRAVWLSRDGALVQIVDFDSELALRLKSFAKGEPISSADTPQGALGQEEGEEETPENEDDEAQSEDEAGEERSRLAANVYERLRGLSITEQRKFAKSSNLAERVALERIYGKSVWEPLLSNQQLTAPEVARIAKMGNLPGPLIELIVSNGRWLSSPLVRRSLLSNPRLKGQALTSVLGTLPKNELLLVPQQTAYPLRIRQEAKNLVARLGIQRHTGSK